MSRLAISVLAGFLASGAAPHAARAQSLSDPTRPPNTSGVADAPGDADAPTTVLQSILISPGRKLAVINGSVVPLGGKVGEATLASISESQVVLKYSDRSEVIKLLGGIERTPVGKEKRSK